MLFCPPPHYVIAGGKTPDPDHSIQVSSLIVYSLKLTSDLSCVFSFTGQKASEACVYWSLWAGFQCSLPCELTMNQIQKQFKMLVQVWNPIAASWIICFTGVCQQHIKYLILGTLVRVTTSHVRSHTSVRVDCKPWSAPHEKLDHCMTTCASDGHW